MAVEFARDYILAMAAAFQESRILLSAAELDLFTKLKDGPRTHQDIADAEGWDPRALRILMDALVSIGLLAKLPEGTYMAEPNALKLLTKGEESVLPMVRHRVHLWETWSNITEIVRTGENPRFSNDPTYSQEETEEFIGAMHVIGCEMAEKIAADLDLSRRSRLLDIGGGSGVYTIAFLEKAPQLKATVFDLPEVIGLSKRYITDAGLIDRVEFVSGDYNESEFPTGHDLALLSAIIHINSRDGNRSLFRRIYQALDQGGALLIRDHSMDEARTDPAAGTIFAVNMLAATRAGDTYTLGEVKEDLEAAGFGEVELVRDGTEMDQLVRGTKK
jgi:SAM-dependent methyltransferase